MTEKPEKCEWVDCDRPAIQQTLLRGEWGEGSKLGWYCDTHADIAANSQTPEYIVDCPACGCRFGVN